jgi:nicotinamide-nucleotide amidase
MNKKITAFIKKLKKKKLKLALAESVTCGMATEKLATAIGTSDVLAGSIVCYSPEVKTDLLKVPKKVIDAYTCESMEVTKILTTRLSKLIKADIHAAITGLASEGGSETKDKPVGTIFFCVRYKKKVYQDKKVFRGSPLEIRLRATMHLYEFILTSI